ncbi:MAG: hypothetical protein FGM61_06215 [Sediminibacterium sp.]|nr:hypothetical protein [Sediminibacterium sp.]
MRLVKFALISALVLFLLLLGIGLLMPSKVVVSRAINLPVPAGRVVPYMQDVRQWPQWMQGLDSNQITSINDSVYQIGNLKVQWIERSNNAMISQWNSDKGSMQVSTMRVIADSANAGCTVQWQFEQPLGWLPWERLGSMLNEKIMGPQLEANLQQLRNKVLATP